MNKNKQSWESLAPLTGVALVALFVAAFIVGGEPPEADSATQEIVDFYVDDKDAVIAGALLFGLALVFMAFFAGSLRAALRKAEGEGGVLSAVVLVGAAIFAIGPAIDGAMLVALAEDAGNLEPATLQGLQSVFDNNFIPYAVGAAVFLIAAGISIVRHGALPRWLGWVAIVLGVASATPAFIVAFLLVGVWILIVSVLLVMQARAVSPE